MYPKEGLHFSDKDGRGIDRRKKKKDLYCKSD